MINQKNIYQQKNLQNSLAAEKEIVNKAHSDSKNAIETGVIPRGFNQSILNYTSQFENYQRRKRK